MSNYASPLTEESSPRNGSVELDIKALVQEAYEIVKAQIEVVEGSTMERQFREDRRTWRKMPPYT